jgi:Zn-dependent peptidase ImmA (M78 family)
MASTGLIIKTRRGVTMYQAEKKAKELLENQGITGPPVPVETIARKIGVELVFEPFKGEDDISGILYREGEQSIIGINSAHVNTRQRFSIAHEIGHLVLHTKRLFVDKIIRIDFRDATSSLAIDNEEISANVFAAELLMPRNFIEREMKRISSKRKSLPSKEKLIKELANILDVSLQAM